MIAFSDLPERIIFAIKLAFQHLFAYNVPFMPEFIAVLFGVFVAVLLVLLAGLKIKLSAKLSILFLLCMAIIASQTHIALAKIISTNIVTDYYGVLFLRVLIVMLAFKLITQPTCTQILWQNLIFALSCIIIWAHIVQSLSAQKTQKLGMEHDFRLINRIVDRIEQNEHFDYDKKYCGIMFGQIEKRSDFIGFNIFPNWEMQSVFRYTMQKDVFAGCKIYNDLMQKHHDKNWHEQDFNTLISRLHKAGILDKLEPFPHKNSVVVFEDIIVFVASEGNLDEIRQMAKELP